MSNKVLDITGFLKLILEALKVSKVDYMIGGAIAEWAWGEPRACAGYLFICQVL